MIKSEKFYVHSDALKNKDFSMLDYVTALVRNTELSNVQNRKTWKDAKKALEAAHANIDVMECEDAVVIETLKNDAGQFLKDRLEIKALKEECTTCIPMDKITSLCLTDRVHVTLMAHAIYKSVVLDADIFDTEKGGVDISKAIQAYYNKGSMKDLKDALRPVFNKLLGTEGDHFYAVKTKKSDFAEKDLRHFLASFGGDAKRETSTKGKETVFSNYDYIDKSDNKKVQISAFTRLCEVVLDNASKHSVIKSNTKDEKEEKTA